MFSACGELKKKKKSLARHNTKTNTFHPSLGVFRKTFVFLYAPRTKPMAFNIIYEKRIEIDRGEKKKHRKPDFDNKTERHVRMCTFYKRTVQILLYTFGTFYDNSSTHAEFVWIDPYRSRVFENSFKTIRTTTISCRARRTYTDPYRHNSLENAYNITCCSSLQSSGVGVLNHSVCGFAAASP